jgi:phosphatidate cytidylyltransferase
VLIAALVAVLFLLPQPALVALVALLVFAAALEWARLCRLATMSAMVYAAVLTALYILLHNLGIERELFALAALFWIAVVPVWMWRGLQPAHTTWLGAAGFAVLLPAALALVTLTPLEVLLVLVLVWIADTAAYFIGRAWGRRKLAPSISPGKTWEGAIGGVVAALAMATLAHFWFFRELPLKYMLPLAAVMTLVGILGDLAESALKRGAGAKDAANILPGHGGILDRLDSLLFNAPLIYYFARFYFHS